jgi:hypothetical protein
MYVWARVYPVTAINNHDDDRAISLKVSAELFMSLYRLEESARKAAGKHGGIVLQISAESLRGQLEFESVSLTREDDALKSSRTKVVEASPRQTYVMVVFGEDIDHKWNKKTLEATFLKSEGLDWLNDLEKALEADIHQ